MTEVPGRLWPRDSWKGAFWLALAGLVALSAWLDDRFVFNLHDREWPRLLSVMLLLPHAICGVTALMLGPLQFSDRLRAARPGVHRNIGWIYVVAALFAGPSAAVIALQHHPFPIAIVQTFQGGLWALATIIALYYAVRRRFQPHRLWMMRSYGFCLVFVLGRLPDLVPHFDWPGVPGVTVMWTAILIALIGPDLILAAREEARRR